MATSTHALARAIAVATMLCGGGAFAQAAFAPDAGTAGESVNPHDVKNKDRPPEGLASPAQQERANAIDPNSTKNRDDSAHPGDTMHTQGNLDQAEAGNPHAANANKKMTSKEVIEILHGANQDEIAAGKLAQAQGGPRVADYGRMLVTDHTAADQDLTAVASQLGVTLSDTPSSAQAKKGQSEAKEMRDHMAAMKGADFDKKFAKDMEEDHHKDVAMVRTALGTCSDAPLCALLKQELPTLQHHEQLAKALQKPAAQGRRPE